MVTPTTNRTNHDEIIRAYCQRLPHLVRYRLDPRLLGRISSTEIAAELAAALRRKSPTQRCSRRHDLLRCLRATATTQLEQIHRDYLALHRDFGDPYFIRLLSALPRASVTELAGLLLGVRPAHAQRHHEGAPPSELLALQCVYNSLSFVDREVLAMRHFERLTKREMATILQMQIAETCERYVIALGRLKREFYRLDCLRVIPLVSHAHA